ncbi:pilus assembly protein [Loktanella sp. 1ANDIMAR09]|nr:pilus assembly protein [Loktanella sp. 1ANDIMAR09]
MTYSIVARDPQTGAYGVAVASRFFAVGALVPHIRGGKGAVATQAFVNPMLGVEGARRLADGETAQAILNDMIARDGGRSQRQIHLIDSAGHSAAHTGAECIDWAGHLIGSGVSVAGNMLAGPAVVADTLAAYEANLDLPFAERLLTAMEAGAAAGGDKRGTQSAALCIHRTEDYPWLDIRADDHPDPLAELRRLLDVAGERFLHVAEIMPTADNFSGVTDRSAIDAAIAAEEARRKAEGRKSRSFATELKS